ncbi:MAG: hypothetical protein AABX89_05505 [Candidatus Thermoplasmatota archaeon]
MPADPTFPISTPALVPPVAPGAAPEAETRKRKRRINTSSKGAQVELLAIKLLEAAGYKVHRCVRTGSKRGPLWISQSNDVFGCIDLVGKKRGERTRWVQVTADSGIGRKRREMDEVPWDPIFDSVEIWRWVGGQSRKHKSTGRELQRQYFQVYHFDDGYELRPERRIAVAPGNDTLAHDANNRDFWEVAA